MNHSLSFRLRKVAIVFGSAAVGMLIAASTHAAENPGYIEDPSRRTTGIGKFYMGREISFVMGHQAAGWLNRPGRIQEEMPDEVVANMGLEPDHVVADIGAGSGYFSFRIAKLVPEGKVLAVDIQQEMLDIIEATKATEGVTNIDGVKGEIDNPNLPANSIDAAIMVDAYHEFSHPFEMINGIYNALRPGGRIFLLEYRGEDASVPIRPLHKMTQEQVIKEMSIFGLEWTETLDFLPWQHMMIFTKTD
ncbi:MAG: class I SAM-dependent methyltransferase [Proteobacteria bacterium]|nr:methyltransferase domain-containing protein [Pseudomonadales bacterium]MBL6804289.1 methyltransferase domain-containing protein [Pseudomonadales bacterium]MDA0896236.1 class I SAM-dependent methyltransferase [Pseudomonadota bacterium]MDA1244516.1 class I SAM-dependent methyltransferase [Pseudomonadota bacterium]